LLYRLPEVLSGLGAGETIWIAEGEKDANSLRGCGLIATTSPHGTQPWEKEALSLFNDATVRIVRDEDERGLPYAARLRADLEEHALSVTLLRPANGKDITDHLEAGLTVEDLVEIADLPKPVDLGALLANPTEPPRAKESFSCSTFPSRR
jgi:DNA primase